MKFCWCTIGSENPEACKNCSNNSYEGILTTTSKFLEPTWWYSLEKLNTYNPETHDLVEKKDAKITRLRKEVDELQRLLDFESKVIDERISSLAERKLELDKLKDELSKAEQE